MKKLLISALFLAAASMSVNALETDVKPTVTDIKNHNPKTGLIVGNSYSFYNCGVHGYLRGLTREESLRSVPAGFPIMTFRSTWVRTRWIRTQNLMIRKS